MSWFSEASDRYHQYFTEDGENVGEDTVACMHANSFQLCLTLCDPVVYRPPDSSVHGILQARILDWVAMPSSRESSDLEMEPTSLMFPAWAGRFITTSATWEAPTCGSSIQKWKILGEESQDQKVA